MSGIWPAVAIVVAAGFYIWSLGQGTGFLLCDMECGETLLAVRAAEQYAQFGVRYGLLENLGSITEPVLYTHSVNIGSLSFVALEALGIHAFSAKIFLPLAVYCLGLLYVFLAVRKVAESPAAALIALCLFAGTYWGMSAFALNALRAWHLLAFFMIVFHCASLARSEWRAPNLIGLLLGASVAFGCGYDYWIICGAVGVSVAAANMSQWRLSHVLAVFLTIAVLFAVPFGLRQAQIIYAMGLEYWLTDLKYSVAIKIPYAADVIRIPSLTEIDSWYKSQRVIRPPASPSNDPMQMLRTLQAMVQHVAIPRWGWLALLVLGGAVAAGVLGLACRRISLAGPGLALCSRAIVPVVAGVTFGVALLAPFTLHVYFKHEFPLIGFAILLAKAAALVALFELVKLRWRKLATAASLGILAVLADHALVAYNNSQYGLYPNFGWAAFMRAHPNARYELCAFTGLDPGSVPTLEKILGIEGIVSSVHQPPCETQVIRRLRNGEADYVIYQPATMVVDLDAAVPTCSERDWLSRLLANRRSQVAAVPLNCIYGSALQLEAVHQPVIAEMIGANSDLGVAARSDDGIGYVILRFGNAAER